MTTSTDQSLLADCPATRVIGATRRRILASPYRNVFRSVFFEFDSGQLILQGHVSSFYFKQLLQEIVRGVDDIVVIDNQVQVE